MTMSTWSEDRSLMRYLSYWFMLRLIEPCFIHFSSFTDKNLNNECAFFCNLQDCVKRNQLANDKIDCHGPEGHIDETWGKLEGIPLDRH